LGQHISELSEEMIRIDLDKGSEEGLEVYIVRALNDSRGIKDQREKFILLL